MKIECPKCGKNIDFNTNAFVDVKENPELKPAIIQGEFFMITCTDCGDQTLVEYPLTYMDPDKKLNIHMEPGHDKTLLDNLNSLELPEEAIDKEAVFRVVNNGVELMEKILIYEKNRDDRVIELYKFIIWNKVLEIWPKLIPGDLIYGFDNEGEYLIIWTSDNGKGEKFTIPMEEKIYMGLKDNYKKQLEIQPGKYAEVNQDWVGRRFSR